MRIRIEIIDQDAPEEIVIFCRSLTPEIEALSRALGRSYNTVAAPGFYKGEEQYFPAVREILFFETEGESIFAHTAGDSYEVKQRLYELEGLLPPYFIRISRSTIVNTLHVFSIQKNIARVGLITFRNSHKEVYVSRMYSKFLKERMEERHLYEKV